MRIFLKKDLFYFSACVYVCSNRCSCGCPQKLDSLSKGYRSLPSRVLELSLVFQKCSEREPSPHSKDSSSPPLRHLPLCFRRCWLHSKAQLEGVGKSEEHGRRWRGDGAQYRDLNFHACSPAPLNSLDTFCFSFPAFMLEKPHICSSMVKILAFSWWEEESSEPDEAHGLWLVIKLGTFNTKFQGGAWNSQQKQANSESVV